MFNYFFGSCKKSDSELNKQIVKERQLDVSEKMKVSAYSII